MRIDVRLSRPVGGNGRALTRIAERLRRATAERTWRRRLEEPVSANALQGEPRIEPTSGDENGGAP